MMRSFTLFASLTLAALAGQVVSIPAAHAEPARASSDPAAAQALFYEARGLMREGKFALACPKLEESLRLDYGMGTEFNLADCNEKLGKIASAWSGFINVAAAAKGQGQPQREKVARDRARALEPRLPKLSVDVAAGATPGLEVKRDGVAIGAASFGTPVPVDPGVHRIVASAPGRQSWEASVTIAEGKTQRVSVPQLAPGAVAEGAPPPVPVVIGGGTGAATAAHDATFPQPVVERSNTQRTVGWVVAAAGLAGLGVGAGFGIDSLQKRQRSGDHCDGNLCDEQGVALRDRAISSGDIATVTTVAGGAVLLGGLIVILTSPRSTHKEAPRASLSAVPHVALNGGGFSLQGVLP